MNILMLSHKTRSTSFARPLVVARNLVRRGHKATLVVISDTERVRVRETICDGLSVVESPDLLTGRGRSGWDIWDTLRRILYLRRDLDGYDILHCFETRPVTIYPALMYRRWHRLPVVTDWIDWWGRGGVIDHFRPRLYRLMLGGLETYYEEKFRVWADGLTVIASPLKERAVRLGVCPERIAILPGGVDLEAFRSLDKTECRSRLGVPSSARIVGFSSYDVHRDLEMLLKAFALLRQRLPDALLMVTGRIDSRLQARLARDPSARGFILTGLVPYHELPVYVGCIDVAALPFGDTPYNRGRWPNKLCDYMAAARPTVTNDVGDVGALLRREPIGLLSGEEPEAFAAGLAYLLENPSVATEMGRHARVVAEEKYAWTVLIRQLERFYEKWL